MKLCVLSREEPEKMKAEIEEMFSKIENKGIGKIKLKVEAYPKKQLGKLVQVVPSKEKYKLTMMFRLPRMVEHYKSCPSQYLSHLIGHEGENSLFSLL